MDCEYIEEFSKRGFMTDENLHLLAVSHGIKQALQLWHRKNKMDVSEVAAFID